MSGDSKNQNPPLRVSRPAFRAVVIGGSAGGAGALAKVLAELPPDFALPLLVVQHLHVSDDGALARHLARATRLRVVEPCDKEGIEAGCVYVAPANYHLLVERGGTIALSTDEKVNWSRPSIDVLFESAALACGEGAIAIVLSGANADGAKGVQAIKTAGGRAVAQAPTEAEYPIMPQAAIDTGVIDEVLRSHEIGRWLIEHGTRRPALCVPNTEFEKRRLI